MGHLLCNTLFRMFGHRICCGHIPDWTAHVGQNWQPIDVAPWNLYNMIWWVQTWIRSRVD